MARASRTQLSARHTRLPATCRLEAAVQDAPGIGHLALVQAAQTARRTGGRRVDFDAAAPRLNVRGGEKDSGRGSSQRPRRDLRLLHHRHLG
eukprot:scaffold137199_cov133-Phaeocystis_antarctica.AAC.1